MRETNKTLRIVRILAQIVAALILLQTLFFKFTGAEESVAIFQKLGAEPWGRIGSGIVELIAAVMLLIPSTAAIGGLIAAGMMVGAIGSHLTRLGIEVDGDGGVLFAMAWLVLICGLLATLLRRDRLPWTLFR